MSERMVLTDARLEAALTSRVPSADDGRLLSAIIDEARTIPQARRPWWSRRPGASRRLVLIVVAVAVIALLAGSVLIAGRRPDPKPGLVVAPLVPSPSPAAVVTPSPDASATPSASHVPAYLDCGTRQLTVTTGGSIPADRREPSTVAAGAPGVFATFTPGIKISPTGVLSLAAGPAGIWSSTGDGTRARRIAAIDGSAVQGLRVDAISPDRQAAIVVVDAGDGFGRGCSIALLVQTDGSRAIELWRSPTQIDASAVSSDGNLVILAAPDEQDDQGSRLIVVDLVDGTSQDRLIDCAPPTSGVMPGVVLSPGRTYALVACDGSTAVVRISDASILKRIGVAADGARWIDDHQFELLRTPSGDARTRVLTRFDANGSSKATVEGSWVAPAELGDSFVVESVAPDLRSAIIGSKPTRPVIDPTPRAYLVRIDSATTKLPNTRYYGGAWSSDGRTVLFVDGSVERLDLQNGTITGVSGLAADDAGGIWWLP